MSEPLAGAVALPDGTLVRGRGRREPLPEGPRPQFGLYLGRPPDEPRRRPGVAGFGRSGLEHAGSDHAGPDHAGPDHAGPDHAGPDHAGPDHAGLERLVVHRPGFGRRQPWRPDWPAEWIDWPDFRTPRDGDRAAEQIAAAYRRAKAGERVEVACGGGTGRTGTVLACMAVLAGHPASDAVAWTRRHYRRHAVETPAQRRWIAWFADHHTHRM